MRPVPCRGSRAALAPAFVLLLSCGATHRRDSDASVPVTRVSGEVDTDCDGVRDSCLVTETDAEGHRLLDDAVDDDCDGEPDRFCTRVTYDGNGQRTSVISDDDCDGEPDGPTCWHATYDGAGRQTSFMTEACGGDGPRSCILTSYADDGYPSSESYDSECDGEPDRCSAFARVGDDPSRLLEAYAGCNESGRASCEFAVYDEHGREVEGGVDEDCDGVAESCWTHAYDGEGGDVLTGDADCDGTPDACMVMVDTETRQFEGFDEDCDGVADSGCERWTQAPDGSTTSVVHDEDCDGEPDGWFCSRATWDVDAGGGMVEVDHDCDGEPDRCVTYYDDYDDGP